MSSLITKQLPKKTDCVYCNVNSFSFSQIWFLLNRYNLLSEFLYYFRYTKDSIAIHWFGIAAKFQQLTEGLLVQFFFQMFRKDCLSKTKLHWNIIFLGLSGKMILIFPTNMIWSFCQKGKEDLLPKKYTWRWHFRHH